MRISLEDATLILSLLTEGSSIRSAELLRLAGEKCEAHLSRLVREVPVSDVQADEIWSFVGMKEKTKKRKDIADPEMGDAYTFVAMERTSKVLLAWHLGRRTADDTNVFMAKLASVARPVEGAERFQLSTDGFQPYPAAVEAHLGGRVDYAQLVKTYSNETVDSERRYSPARIISAEKVCSGHPRRRADLHLARRAAEPPHADAAPAVHPPHQTLSAGSGRTCAPPWRFTSRRSTSAGAIRRCGCPPRCMRG